jgi:hypothetical protein
MITHSLKPVSTKDKLNGVVRAIEELAYAKGEGNKLPTVREMAEALHTSVATVDKALGVLATRGVIVRKRGSGVYVATNHTPKIGVVFNVDVFSMEGMNHRQLIFQAFKKRSDSESCSPIFYIDIPDADRDADFSQSSDFMGAIQSGKLSGMIIFAGNDPLQEMLEDVSVPVICIGSAGGGDLC